MKTVYFFERIILLTALLQYFLNRERVTKHCQPKDLAAIITDATLIY